MKGVAILAFRLIKRFLSLNVDENDVVLTISDTGAGMDEETQNKIFDPFFTTKDVGEGTGLGLAVTYSLVQQMQGEISVESRAHEGTRFHITIPVGDQYP